MTTQLSNCKAEVKVLTPGVHEMLVYASGRQSASILDAGKQLVWPLEVPADAELNPVALQAVEAMKYLKPSPIQMAAIPLGMRFRDVIGVAETVCLSSFLLT